MLVGYRWGLQVAYQVLDYNRKIQLDRYSHIIDNGREVEIVQIEDSKIIVKQINR